MAPALARRTPQVTQNEGRPKRQAALNRKETPGLPKKKAESSPSKTEKPSAKKKVEPSTSKKNEKAEVKSKTATRGKQAEPKTPQRKASPRKASPKKTVEPKKKAAPAAKSTPKKGIATKEKGKEKNTEIKRKPRGRKSKKEEESQSQDETEEEEQVEEEQVEIEEENLNEVDLQDDENKISSNEDSQEDESSAESEIDDGELDDEEDEDFDPENDPDKLWCFCKKPHGNRFMICCDTCEDWFHGDCVGVSMSKGREMEKTGEEWVCKMCKEKVTNAQGQETTTTKQDSSESLSFKSPLNSPIKKVRENHPQNAVTTKARSLSLDSMKNNLAKLKGRKLSLNDSHNKNHDQEDEEGRKSKADNKLQLIAEKTDVKNETAKKEDKKSLKSEETSKEENKSAKIEKPKQPKVEIPGFTFAAVPSIKEGKLERKRSLDRRDSAGHDDSDKKRKDSSSTKIKVRTAPTPKSTEPVKTCLRAECSRPVTKGWIYCSRECIYKYTTDSIKSIEVEKKKKLSSTKSPDPKTTSQGTVISPATSSTDRVMETTQERIAVFEKATGKIVAGVMAPTKKYLFAWLEEHPTYEVLKRGKNPSEVKNPKRDQDEVVRNNVRKSIRDTLVGRCKESEMAINIEAVAKISRKVEAELLKMFCETGQKYKTKYRSLIFNLKDPQNKILYRRLVSGEISPAKLVHMSPEQLAAPELARWRQQESKHQIEMVKKREQEAAELAKTSVGIKKTHKGEIEIDADNANMENLEIKADLSSERRRSNSVSSDITSLLKDTTDEHAHHLFDSNCKICTGKVVPPGESQITGVSTTVVQAVPESSVPSPDDDSIVLSSPPSPDTSSAMSPLTPTTPTPPPSARKQPSVWRGFVSMQKVSKFVCTAYAVSGTCENLMETLPDTIHVCGRIPPDQVWDYLTQMKEGRKNQNKFIDVIRFEMSSNEEKSGYIKLYTYFYTRQRIGVVGNCYSGVKDMYILPLASHDPLPPQLKPLPGLPKPRPHMLLGIIVRVKAMVKLKRNEPSVVDSSPEVVLKKKKKKKEKKVKEFDKEKVEVEAQKKLLDIIFQNRGSSEPGSSGSQATSSLIKDLDPATILKTLDLKEKSAREEQKEDKVKVNEDESNDVVSPSAHIKHDHKKLEEEQLRKLKEQQDEINRLQQEIQFSKHAENTESLLSPENISIPSPANIMKNFNKDSNISEETNKRDDADCIEQESCERISNDNGDEDLAGKESILIDTDFKIDVSPAASSVIPFMESTSLIASSNTVKQPSDPRSSSFLDKITPKVNPDAQLDPQQDDDYVMNLIEDIKISQSTPSFPLDIKKMRQENKMPGLPAIQLPISSTFQIPPPSTFPRVPLPPDIKLPPGVPFPPLPPKPIQIQQSRDVLPDTPQSPPDANRGMEQVPPSDPRRGREPLYQHPSEGGLQSHYSNERLITQDQRVEPMSNRHQNRALRNEVPLADFQMDREPQSLSWRHRETLVDQFPQDIIPHDNMQRVKSDMPQPVQHALNTSQHTNFPTMPNGPNDPHFPFTPPQQIRPRPPPNQFFSDQGPPHQCGNIRPPFNFPGPAPGMINTNFPHQNQQPISSQMQPNNHRYPFPQQNAPRGTHEPNIPYDNPLLQHPRLHSPPPGYPEERSRPYSRSPPYRDYKDRHDNRTRYDDQWSSRDDQRSFQVDRGSHYRDRSESRRGRDFEENNPRDMYRNAKRNRNRNKGRNREGSKNKDMFGRDLDMRNSRVENDSRQDTNSSRKPPDDLEDGEV